MASENWDDGRGTRGKWKTQWAGGGEAGEAGGGKGGGNCFEGGSDSGLRGGRKIKARRSTHPWVLVT